MINNKLVLEAIRCGKLLELDVTNPDHLACMCAAIMCKDVHINNIGTLLGIAYRSQTPVFIEALATTTEFISVRDLIVKLSNKDMNKPNY